MAVFFVREKHIAPGQGEFRNLGSAASRIWRALSMAGRRFHFSIQFQSILRPGILYYQTDVLGFGQQYIGVLSSIGSAASIAGAFIYAPLSRVMPLRRRSTSPSAYLSLTLLAYLAYRGETSAIFIHVIWGVTGMITMLAFLNLAARSVPALSARKQLSLRC